MAYYIETAAEILLLECPLYQALDKKCQIKQDALTMPRTITDYDIQALVDNELDWEEEEQVLDYIERNEWAQKRYVELTEQKKVLQSWWTETKLH